MDLGTKPLLCPGNGGLGRALRGDQCSHPGQDPRAGRGHRGNGFYPNREATEEWGAQPCSPIPRPGTSAHPPPQRRAQPPHFHPSRGQPWRVQQDPAHLRKHPGVPRSCPEPANPLAPRSPVPVGSEARTSRSQTPMARRSRPPHPRQERGDPLGSGDEPPAHGRALAAAAARSCSPPALVSCFMSKL